MAKINRIPAVLLTTLLCFYSGACCAALGCGVPVRGYGLRVVSYRLNVETNQKRLILQRTYTTEIGVRELTGKNDGPRVETYLKAVGLGPGLPWCAAFVCWALSQAGLPHPGNGWSPSLFPASRVVWQVSSKRYAGRPQTGEVFGIWFPDKKRIAHVGFVDSWTDTWLISVEGNTNETGSNEGDGVYRKRRLTKSIYQVADWVSAVAPGPAKKGGGG